MPNMLTIDESAESSGSGGSLGGKVSEAGMYLCIAEKFTRKEGRKGDYLAMCFRVIAKVGDGGEFNGSYAKKYFYDNLSLSQTGRWKVARLAHLVGVKRGESFDLDDDGSIEEALCNREVVLNIDIQKSEQWGDSPRWASQGRAVTKEEKENAKKLYDELGRPYDEGWRTKPAGSSSSYTNGSVSSDDDDLPF